MFLRVESSSLVTDGDFVTVVPGHQWNPGLQVVSIMSIGFHVSFLQL